MKIPNQAYLDNANHNFAHGARTAVVEFLRELERRGVRFDDDYTLLDLAAEVRQSTGQNLLDEE